jgi:hypothetical protein
VDKTNHWITNGSLNLLYVPFDLRPGMFATNSSSLLVIATASGRLTIIKLRSNVNPDSV